MLGPDESRAGERSAGMYEVVLSREAQRAFTAADGVLCKKLGRCFAQMEVDPRTGNNIKRLSGPLAGYWQFRVGDRRVVYEIDDATKIVTVVTISHRRDVYG